MDAIPRELLLAAMAWVMTPATAAELSSERPGGRFEHRAGQPGHAVTLQLAADHLVTFNVRQWGWWDNLPPRVLDPNGRAVAPLTVSRPVCGQAYCVSVTFRAERAGRYQVRLGARARGRGRGESRVWMRARPYRAMPTETLPGAGTYRRVLSASTGGVREGGSWCRRHLLRAKPGRHFAFWVTDALDVTGVELAGETGDDARARVPGGPMVRSVARVTAPEHGRVAFEVCAPTMNAEAERRYALHVVTDRPRNAPPKALRAGQTARGTLGPGDDWDAGELDGWSDAYRMRGTKGSWLELRACSRQLDVKVSVEDPDGAVLLSGDDNCDPNGVAMNNVARLPADGEYTIRVGSDYSQRGAYSIRPRVTTQEP